MPRLPVAAPLEGHWKMLPHVQEILRWCRGFSRDRRNVPPTRSSTVPGDSRRGFGVSITTWLCVKFRRNVPDKFHVQRSHLKQV